jgi:hypothetical protein
VVRRAHHALAPLRHLKRASQTEQRSRLQRLHLVQARQHADKALRQHRLARARRPDHEQAVTAAGRRVGRLKLLVNQDGKYDLLGIPSLRG